MTGIKYGARLMAGLLVIFLAACSTPPAKDSATAEPEQGFVACESPRPQMCTREYRPVCGHIDTGIRCVTEPCESEKHHTFGNGCSACAAPEVIGYEFGSCESYGK